jgi:hypothetical protein
VVFVEHAYRRFVSLACALPCPQTPAHVRASHACRATFSFPDRAEHAAQPDLTTIPSDHYSSSNLRHVRRVGARDVGKAAAARRWVGASNRKRPLTVDDDVVERELKAFDHDRPLRVDFNQPTMPSQRKFEAGNERNHTGSLGDLLTVDQYALSSAAAVVSHAMVVTIYGNHELAKEPAAFAKVRATFAFSGRSCVVGHDATPSPAQKRKYE